VLNIGVGLRDLEEQYALTRSAEMLPNGRMAAGDAAGAAYAGGRALYRRPQPVATLRSSPLSSANTLAIAHNSIASSSGESTINSVILMGRAIGRLTSCNVAINI
jgi:hypothetical protein